MRSSGTRDSPLRPLPAEPPKIFGEPRVLGFRVEGSFFEYTKKYSTQNDNKYTNNDIVIEFRPEKQPRMKLQANRNKILITLMPLTQASPS